MIISYGRRALLSDLDMAVVLDVDNNTNPLSDAGLHLSSLSQMVWCVVLRGWSSSLLIVSDNVVGFLGCSL